MQTNKIITILLAFILYFTFGCSTAPTSAPLPSEEPTSTHPPKPLSPTPPEPTHSITPTPLPPTPNNAPITAAAFPIGPGGSDVIPHQIVRTNNDFLYIFAIQQSSNILRAYHTKQPGFPNTTDDFAVPLELPLASFPISVDVVYDGHTLIHVLTNSVSGEIQDHPFDISTNTFKTSLTLATNGGIPAPGLYVGTSGISGMMDTNGIIHVAYWTNENHILHRAYTYDSTTNSLSPASDFTQVDSTGNANHPALAISPFDNSLTVAWVSETNDPAQILSRTRQSDGTWDDIEIASTAPVWTSKDNGINIDQGPSLLIDSNGTRHLTYIQLIDYSVGDYGRIHYVTNNGSGWVDQPLNAFSHDPALAINSEGKLYIIGHGHPLNPSCQSMDEMCFIENNGTWSNPITFASPPAGFSFDCSPSVKWSVVGFNRPDIIEFIFFMTPYHEPTLYYGRIP
ncbi:MAG TPA: hypothetical protein VNK49_02150 [Anaerolineales bacterium]|nr:hypothetical protein [Anaerolineales bacterium]